MTAGDLARRARARVRRLVGSEAAVEPPQRAVPADPFLRLLRDQSQWADPFPLYEEIRARGPIYCVGPLGVHVAASYEAVSEVLRHDKVVVEPAIDDPDLAGIGSGSLIRKNPPRHGELRRVIGQGFSPRRVRALGEQVQETSVRRLEAALETGQFDAVQDYALPIALGTIANILGIPEHYHESLRIHGDGVARALDIFLTPEQWATTRAASIELQRYFSQLFEERRRTPGEDLLTTLLEATASEVALSDLELMANAEFALLAGYETTVGMIGSGFDVLLDRPELWAEMRADPSLVDGFVEEVLRLHSPVQFTKRVVTEDVDVVGTRVPAGSPVVTLLGAANRDPATFPDPLRFDPRRPNANRHVAFVVGPHHCLGSALARLEGQVAFRTLLDRAAGIRRAGSPVRRPNLIARGWASIPVVVTRG